MAQTWSKTWSILLVYAMTALGGGIAEGETAMANALSAVHFERSGGIVALGRPLAGDVSFGAAPSVADAGGTGKPRSLTAAEKTMFEHLDAAKLRAFGQTRRAQPPKPAMPDDYQFDVTLTFADRGAVKLTFYGQSVAELRAVPGLAELAAWVQSEADAILARR